MPTVVPLPFTCRSCDASLDAGSEGDPCPVCGGTERRRENPADTHVEVVALVGGVSILVGRPRVPTWEILWAQIERRMARLREMYDSTSSPVSNVVMEDEIDALLTCLNHVSDWLRHDDALNKKKMPVSKPLALCRDYVNTFKHHTRNDPKARLARLEATTIDMRGQSARIRYWSMSEPEQSIDALRLAEQCYAAWREWLTRQGVVLT